jgi:hypothetical protein
MGVCHILMLGDKPVARNSDLPLADREPPFLPHAPIVTISSPARASTTRQNLPARSIQMSLMYTWVITVSSPSATK